MNPTRIAIPTLVRIKSGALARLGVYLTRFGHRTIAVFSSAGLLPTLTLVARTSLEQEQVDAKAWVEIQDNDFARAIDLFTELPREIEAIVGLGGGKALDVAKYVAFLANVPYYAVPTSLSNDGFASPQVSLVIDGRRRSLAAAMPFGVVVDTSVCVSAPRPLTLSGVGDLAAKFTAIYDWKLAFHRVGELVDDFAALLADSTVHAFLARPILDEEGLRLLATSLLFNGIAMEVCGSSRPASGSEHMISHALDEFSGRPRLHGLQVGVATYLVSLLQQSQSDVIAGLFDRAGFWELVAEDPFLASELLAAVRRAPTVKKDRYTVLSTRDVLPEVETALRTDPWLARVVRWDV